MGVFIKKDQFLISSLGNINQDLRPIGFALNVCYKGKTKYEHYAARFAVKEAAFKALSEGVEDKYQISWKDVETSNDENGRPEVEILFLNPKNVENVDVSISHCRDYAIANVTVLLK